MKTFKEFVESVKEPTGDLKKACWKGYTAVGMKMKNGRKVPNCVPTKESTSWYPKKGFPKEGEYGYHPNPGLQPQESDKDKDMDVAYKDENKKEGKKLPNARILEVPNKIEKMKEEIINERGEDSKGYKRSTESGAGLTRKGAAAMGIKTAVTTPPSKLDPKGKAAARRKSFCARMGGMAGPMKDEKGRPTRKAMSLRRWNC